MESRSTKSLLTLGVAVATLGLAMSPSAYAQTIDVWTISYSSDAQINALEGAAEQFEETHPGVEVNITMRGVDEHKTALRVAAGSDSGPDIFMSWAGLGLGGEYVNAGLSQDISDYYEEYGWEDNLSSASMGFAGQYGGMHGIPFRFSGEAVYYNKEQFERAGITEEPSTYDELVAAAEALKSEGIPAFTFGGSVNWHVMRLMDVLLETTCGAETHDQLIGMELSWADEPCAAEAFSELQMWTQNYVLSPFMGIDQAQSFNLFVGERAAMMLEGDWLVQQLAENTDVSHFGVFPFPTGTGRLYGFAEYFYMSSNTEHPELVAEFFDLFVSDEYQDQIKGAFGAISVNTNVSLGDDATPLQEEWLTIFDEATGTFVNGDQGFPLAVTTEYFRVINEVASGNMEPLTAAQEMQTFIDNQS
ncbi:ABC transporter substrate-binding protein [Devosia sp. RR2S18]|uniref:ABC transporter substrate-binding protein n=1 Tax=Devosia rhizosphaerae TaxID=3049774 RepID=UPI0025420DA6|nr:extracellular solute-binding protein [Devosia sp. RR2S18]WIJ26384.1 extracellular solute-binding protein [Devosia sp. RR2S18]